MNESAVQKERREQRQSLFVNETEEPFKLPLQFDALLTELKREIAAYDNVLDAIRLERDVLAKPSLKAIMESNSRKEEALLQAKDVERKRDNLLRKIAALLHLPSEQIRLTAVVDAADPQRKAALCKCGADLASLIVRMRDMNERNRNLIGASLGSVRNSMELITNLMATGGDYVKTGQLKNRPLRGRILSREG